MSALRKFRQLKMLEHARAEDERITSEFKTTVQQATRANIWPVCSVLYDMAGWGQWTLSEGHLDMLANLIRRLGKQGRRGNPGVVAADEVKAAEQTIIQIAKGRLAPIRERNNGSVPHGTIPRVVRQVIERMLEDGRLSSKTKPQLDRQYIRSALKARKNKY